MKKNHRVFGILISLSMFHLACTPEGISLEGDWLGTIEIGDAELPVRFSLVEYQDQWKMQILQAGEVLEYDEVSIEGDSIKIEMGIFDAGISAALNEKGELVGVYDKRYARDYRLPFKAVKNEVAPDDANRTASIDLSGKWKTSFVDAEGKGYDAIGIFEQEGRKLTGTFLTELGDYRFLEGKVNGNSFYLSTFDGSHLYLFIGEMTPLGEIKGLFRSGPRWRETFSAVRDEAFELPDAYSLSFLKEGVEKFDFSFPDLDGNLVSLSDEQFRDKVVLVQIFGTWCPNCMDELAFLAPWYNKHRERGIEIIALAFESKDDFEYASGRVRKTKERMKANYNFLIAGTSSKEKASEALPALNQVVAFPTLIYLDKKGQVREIHTGFNGPGTGAYFEKWVDEHNALIDKLVGE